MHQIDEQAESSRKVSTGLRFRPTDLISPLGPSPSGSDYTDHFKDAADFRGEVGLFNQTLRST